MVSGSKQLKSLNPQRYKRTSKACTEEWWGTINQWYLHFLPKYFIDTMWIVLEITAWRGGCYTWLLWQRHWHEGGGVLALMVSPSHCIDLTRTGTLMHTLLIFFWAHTRTRTTCTVAQMVNRALLPRFISAISPLESIHGYRSNHKTC